MVNFFSFGKKHILVIEDEPDVAELIKLQLTEIGDFKVTLAEKGNEGIQTANSEKPDLILLDCELPDTNGIDVLSVLKNDKKTAKIPVIMLTGRKAMMQIELASNLGVDDYLTKPVDGEELVRRINLYL